MDLEVMSVLFRENEADATIAFRVRGSAGPPAMQMRYTLQRDGSRWSVKSKNEAGGSPHGEGAAPPPQPALPPGHPTIPKQ